MRHAMRALSIWVMLVLTGGLAGAQDLLPNELWWNTGVGPGPSTDPSTFLASASVVFVGTFQSKTAEFVTADGSQTLVTKLNMTVTESIKGNLTVGQSITVLAGGGTYLVLPDGSKEPRRFANVAVGTVAGSSYFVAANVFESKYWLHSAAFVKVDGNSAVGPAESPLWATTITAAGRAQILAATPSANPTDRAAFLAAIRVAAGLPW